MMMPFHSMLAATSCSARPPSCARTVTASAASQASAERANINAKPKTRETIHHVQQSSATWCTDDAPPSAGPPATLVYSPPPMNLGLPAVAGKARALWARVPAARVYDALILLWITVFHRVIGARFRFAPFGFDEHYFLHEGWSVSKGLVPYRDLQEFKPPVIFFVNALGIKLFGLDALGYRQIFSILSVCGFLSLTLALLSRGTNRLLVGGVVALMIDHFFDTVFHNSSNSSINSAGTLALDFFMMVAGALL